jgi:hypothetical protein
MCDEMHRDFAVTSQESPGLREPFRRGRGSSQILEVQLIAMVDAIARFVIG